MPGSPPIALFQKGEGSRPAKVDTIIVPEHGWKSPIHLLHATTQSSLDNDELNVPAYYICVASSLMPSGSPDTQTMSPCRTTAFHRSLSRLLAGSRMNTFFFPPVPALDSI